MRTTFSQLSQFGSTNFQQHGQPLNFTEVEPEPPSDNKESPIVGTGQVGYMKL